MLHQVTLRQADRVITTSVTVPVLALPDVVDAVREVAGHLHPSDGMMARHELRSRHIQHNLGDGVPRLLGTAGFDCVELDSRAGRIGRATFYRATKPQ